MEQKGQVKVRQEIHPRGAPGIHKSISEIIKEVEKGRLDPRTVAWARETIHRAGRPTDQMQQAGAILRRLRQEHGFIPDPVDSEYTVSSACMVEGCHGLKFLMGDCDDLLIPFLSAVEAIGIEAAVVNHGYDPKGAIMDHVLGAVYDRPDPNKVGRWVRCDPSTSQPIGTVSKPTRERMYLVPGGKLLCDSMGFCRDSDLARVGAVRENLRPHGDYVGVGRPHPGAVGQSTVQVEPFMGEVSEAFYEMMLDQLREAYTRLSDGFERLKRQRDEMEIVVTTLGEPLVQEPMEDHTNWTAEMEQQYQTLQYMVPLYLNYLSDAIAGHRRILWDDGLKTILVTGQPGEIAFVQEDGRLVTVDTSNVDVGKLQDNPGQVGQVETIALGVVVIIGLGLVAVCTYVQYRFLAKLVEGLIEVCETIKVSKIIEWSKERIANGEDAEKVGAETRDMLGQLHARNKDRGDKETDPLDDIVDTAKKGLYAFLAVASIGAAAYGVSTVAQWRKGGG